MAKGAANQRHHRRIKITITAMEEVSSPARQVSVRMARKVGQLPSLTDTPATLTRDSRRIAWDACQKASNAPGDCNDMIGPFAAAGCSQAKASIMKPCENKEVQGYLRKEACKKDPTWKYCK